MQIFDLNISSDVMAAGAAGASVNGARAGLAGQAPSGEQGAASGATFATHLNATAGIEAPSRSGLKAGTALDGATAPGLALGGDPVLEAAAAGPGQWGADGDAAADQLFAAAMAALGQLDAVTPASSSGAAAPAVGAARADLLDLVSADRIDSDPIMFPDLSEVASEAEGGAPADDGIDDPSAFPDAVPAVAATVVADQPTPGFFPAPDGSAAAVPAGGLTGATQPDGAVDPLQPPSATAAQGAPGSAGNPVAPAAALPQPGPVAGSAPIAAPRPATATPAEPAPVSASAPMPASPAAAAAEPAVVKAEGVLAGADAKAGEPAAPQQQAGAGTASAVASDAARPASTNVPPVATAAVAAQPTGALPAYDIVAGDGATAGNGQAVPSDAGETLAERAPKSMTAEAPAANAAKPEDANAARAAAPRVMNMAAQKDLDAASGDADAPAADGEAEADGVKRPQQGGEATAAAVRRPAAPASPVAQAATVAAGMAALTASLDAAAADPLQGGDPADMTLAGVARGGEATSHQPAAASGNSPAQTLPMAMMAMEIARNAQRGVSRFEIRLDPPELGRVDVRLKIGDDGQVRAHLIVERPETLDMLLRDQRGMERALENAGLKTAANGGLEFSLKDQGSRSFADGGDRAPGGNSAAAADKADETAVEKQGALERIAAYVRGGAGGLDIRV